jgi:phosphoglycolate phosphatase-like HAD superfamily hydrolase
VFERKKAKNEKNSESVSNTNSPKVKVLDAIMDSSTIGIQKEFFEKSYGVAKRNLYSSIYQYEIGKCFINVEYDKKNSINSIELENLCNHFSNRIIQNVINSPFIPGAIDFLEKYYNDFDLFVVTGTPFKEIEYVILEKNIHKYFRKLYGSPEDKITLTKKLLFDYNYNSNDLVFVGDALADYKAAIENKIDFILVENDDNSKLFQNINTIKIPNLINLHNKISNIKI